VESAPARAGTSRPRLDIIDSARVFATLGVIWTHVAEVQGHPPRVAALGRFGTSFYILAAVLFAYRSRVSGPARPFRDELRMRFRRLVVPYVLWSLLYGVLYYRYGISIGEGWSKIAEWWGPLAGTARHLWFLPFAFLAGTLTSFLTPYVRRLETPVLATFVGLGVPLAYWLFQAQLFFALDRPWELRFHLHRLDRFIEEMPLLLGAIVLYPLIDRLAFGERNEGPSLSRESSVSEPVSRESSPIRREYYAIPLAIAFVFIEWQYFVWAEPLHPYTGGETRSFAHALGCILLAACLLLRDVPFLRKLSRFGKHTYFVFLGHVVVLDAVNVPLQALSSFGSWQLSLLTTVGIFALGTALGPLVSRVPVVRWFYPR
jgi:fucose 4-O-acetylase-like acetyltransferase